jgi:hypothetical protein
MNAVAPTIKGIYSLITSTKRVDCKPMLHPSLPAIPPKPDTKPIILLRPSANPITNCRDRFPGTLRPLSRHAITLNPYCHRRCAVARAIPNCQQIAFYNVPSDRARAIIAGIDARS